MISKIIDNVKDSQENCRSTTDYGGFSYCLNAWLPNKRRLCCSGEYKIAFGTVEERFINEVSVLNELETKTINGRFGQRSQWVVEPVQSILESENERVQSWRW